MLHNSKSQPPHHLLPGLEASAESGEVGETLSVPLLEQNKPPQLPGREKDEMADVELRPDSVSWEVFLVDIYIMSIT